jgi:acyl-CoA synthetase (NDP forming)
MAADLSEELDLPLAVLAPETRAAVAAKLPGFATATNPIDITAALLQNSGLFGDVLPLLAKDPAADLFFINIPVAGAGYDVERFARDAAAFASEAGKPVAIAATQASIAGAFRAAGLVTFVDEGEALGAMAQVASHAALMRKERAQWPEDPPVALAPGKDRFLNEAQSLALLAAHGLPVVQHRVCQTAAQASAALRELGAPVAVKACSTDVPHKSEPGLVELNVFNENLMEGIFESQKQKLQNLGARFEGILVARMRNARREMMVGARVDPVFGPVVIVGDGGKYVEALQDLAVLMPPFDAAEVREALRGLRIAPILAGVRGEPPLDVDALAAVAAGVGRLIRAARGGIASIDLNPVMVGAAGEGAVIVDALVERGDT